jgi:glucose/arabinose dehydrogenase
MQLSTQRIATGFDRPVYVTSPPNDPNRLFVVEKNTGNIRILNPNTGAVLNTPFLTVPASDLLKGGEQGLLGLAFHPNFAANGKFYVSYVAPGGGAAGQTKVVEYTVSASNPNLANPNSARVVLTVDQPAGNHNGGWIDFGPDGYLYVAIGDGGGSGALPGIPDQSGNSQALNNNLLGKILRLDINRDDFAGDNQRNYGIPASNPFVGKPGDDEIWVYGLRNPWRNSFDRLTGDLYTADVGQAEQEEINVQLGNSPGGENYGWKYREGNLVYGSPSAPANLVSPVYVYDHSVGQSITGGYVYRGQSSQLAGTYFFGDFVSGRIWSFRYRNGAVTEFTDRTAELSPASGSGAINNIASFGEDAQGNLYIVDFDGEIFKLQVTNTGGGGQILTGTGSNDTLTGGNGNDTITGNSGSDSLKGGRGNDSITGDIGSDLLQGGIGNDMLQGGIGKDSLLGEAGNDVLTGGAGRDILTGGTGRDRFVYKAWGERGDRITDFKLGEDLIVVSGLLSSFGYTGNNAIADGYVRFTQSTSSTLIQVDTDGTAGQSRFVTLATLSNVQASALGVSSLI